MTKEHELIDWTKSAEEIHNLVRALNPSPVAYTYICGKRVKVLVAQVSTLIRPDNCKCGEVIGCTKKSLTIACGQGAVDLVEVQPDNGKRMNICSYLCGNKVCVGTVLGQL